MKKLILMAAVMGLSSTALAEAVDSRLYTCGGLQALITARSFVFVDSPSFKDFVVANANSCTGSERLESRSVATRDTPDCVVRYREARPDFEGS